MVKDHLILMASISDRRQALLEMPHVRGRLTVADSIALHHRQGLSKASCFVSAVDPWCFPADAGGNEERSVFNIKYYSEQTVDQLSLTARKLSIYNDASVSELYFHFKHCFNLCRRALMCPPPPHRQLSGLSTSMSWDT